MSSFIVTPNWALGLSFAFSWLLSVTANKSSALAL
jgi:hypothetical protein